MYHDYSLYKISVTSVRCIILILKCSLIYVGTSFFMKSEFLKSGAVCVTIVVAVFCSVMLLCYIAATT